MNKKEVLLPFGKVIYQSQYGQGITNDTALLVEEVLSKQTDKNQKVLDLGSGNGIISLMIAWYKKDWQITGLEIQEDLVNLSKENIKFLKLTNTNFIKGDINIFDSPEKFDIIVSNPPYYPASQGKISPILERAISRHEIKTDLKNLLNCIARNLKKDGKAYIIYPKEREEEIDKEIKNIDLKTVEKKIISQTAKMIFKLKKG